MVGSETDQPYAVHTARKREIARERVNRAELLLLRAPEGARTQAVSPQVESCNVYFHLALIRVNLVELSEPAPDIPHVYLVDLSALAQGCQLRPVQ